MISEEIWQEYHTRLRSFIRRKVGDDAVSDDILQIVFLKMHAGLASLKEETKLQSWLFQIARNAVADYYRKRQPVAEIPEWLPQPENDATAKVNRELSECLRPMIEQLPETYREAIILAELQGLTLQEVARLQGTSLSGAKSRVQRGRALLKNMLADCCRLEFDHRGRLCDYEKKDGDCSIC